ncbi:MAG TPA: hybrid sensor histidine kinase/response regulator, partial [Ktedonobacteraceae bacterium]|nr:hybrid sensor histidine kinase/response regulator [Ktedonobacteraceae bacterium]
PGGGACFTLCLPLCAPANVSVAPTTSVENTLLFPESEPVEVETAFDIKPTVEAGTQEIQPGRPVILIVEDHPDMARYLARLLAINYQPVTAFDGTEALAKARAIHPHLILCDIMMPGMSGDQFIKVLHADAELSTIPLMILSALANDTLRIQLLQEGAQDYIVKPFLVEELNARIANLLSMHQARKVLQQALASRNQDIVSLTNQIIMRNRELEVINEELAQKNQLQKDFVSVVSHEFRTTLTGIQGFSELLYTHDFSSAMVKDYALDIHKDALRLNRMITNLLDLEHMKSGKMPMTFEELDLNALLADAVERTRSITSPRHSVRFQPDQALPLVKGSHDQLTQVFTNLLSNAVKYSPAGGEILVKSHLEGDSAHVTVQDSGIGIAAEDIAKLFKPFSRIDAAQTRHIKGTGLGLAIVQQITTLHGGQIWVESIVGQGSTFHVKLPLAAIATLLTDAE